MPAPLFMCRHTWLNRFGLLTAVTVGWADNRKDACGAAAGQALAKRCAEIRKAFAKRLPALGQTLVTPRRKRVDAGQALAAIRPVKRRFAGASSAGSGMLGGQRLSPQQRVQAATRHAVGSTLSTPMPNPV